VAAPATLLPAPPVAKLPAMPVATLPALATTDPLRTAWYVPRVSRVAARKLVPIRRDIRSSGTKRFSWFVLSKAFDSTKITIPVP
jgi:hypothetical protein